MRRWRRPRPHLPEQQLFLILALLIGIFSGLTIVCFRVAIEMAHVALLGSTLRIPPGRLLTVLPAAGLLIAAIVWAIGPGVRGSGVNQTKAAVYIYDGYIAFRTVVGKFVASALAIGSGYSLGPEDPSLHMGAGIASACGRAAGLSRDRLRLIAPVGAAAGLAAAFNSPITAVLFVIEEVIGTWSAMALGAIVVSAVSSVVVQHWFLGDQPLFRVPAYHLTHGWELLVYALMGVLGGLVSLMFVKLALALRGRVLQLKPWTRWVLPSAAGFIVATIAVWYPQVTGAGYEHIDDAMHGQYVWQALAAIALLKVVATALSFASGTPGGLFAPTLFIGAMLGGAVAQGARMLSPTFQGDVGVYALIGMGTMFAGILRAPITSVFMIIEVSGNYSIVLPVMISNTIAYLISRRYQRDAIFDVIARQDGVPLPSMEHRRETVVRRVEDAMAPSPIVLPPELTVHEALRLARESSATELLAHVRPHIWTSVRTETLAELDQAGEGAALIAAALASTPPLPVLHPDETLETALVLLAGQSVVPVLHRADPTRIVGVVTTAGILKSYEGQLRHG